MGEPQSLLQAVAEVASLAGKVALAHYRRGVAVEWKENGTPVTVADREAEAAAQDWIARHFPTDGIHGEESGQTRPDARRRWIIDPIDGTKTFIRRVPLWGTLVAVAEGEQVLAGAAVFPAVEESLAAAVGEGCFWNGARTRVSNVGALSEATVLATDARFPARPEFAPRWAKLEAQAAVARTWGDCYGYLLVATGRAEAMVDDLMAPWDAAALQPIIQEAGGVFTDWEGRPTAFGGNTIATNAALSDAVRSALVRI